MTRALAATLFALVAVPGRAADGRLAFPAYETSAYCRAQANYSFAATLGDSSFDGVLAKCEGAERDAEAAAQALWSTASLQTLAACGDLAQGRYTYLMRCLDGSRTMRTAR